MVTKYHFQIFYLFFPFFFSIQTAEMNAAKLALDTCSHLFPHLDYQKKIVERSLKKNKDHLKESWEEEVRKKRKILGM